MKSVINAAAVAVSAASTRALARGRPGAESNRSGLDTAH